MTDCDPHRLALLLGDERAFERHAAGCADCQRDRPSLGTLGAVLRASPDPQPSPELWSAIERRTTPILAHHAEATRRAPSLLAALGAALLPLPVLLPLNLLFLWGLRTLLDSVLPGAISLALVAGQGMLIVLLLSLTYASVPLLASRQRRALLEEIV
jgi:hypothetical protein